MKKNLTRKLALSAVTMGVAALTVTSTTYAWYTTNSQASASGMKASTAAADSNLLIATQKTGSTAGASGSEATTISEALWGPSVTFADKSDSSKLLPVQYYSASTTAATDSEKAEKNAGWYDVSGNSSTAVLTYRVWFSATGLDTTKSYSLKMQITGATFSEKAQQNFEMDANKTGGTNVSYKQGHQMEVGLQDVLSLKITKNSEYTVKENNTGYDSLTIDTKVTAADQYYRFLNEDATGADAVNYYNNVMGLSGNSALVRPTSASSFVSGVKTDNKKTTNFIAYGNSTYGIGGSTKSGSSTDYENGTKVNIATINGNSVSNKGKDVYFGLDITLFIDGWDYQCFNAVSSTSLESMNLQFELTKNNQ